jgi:hypothetical protein
MIGTSIYSVAYFNEKMNETKRNNPHMINNFMP